MSVSCSVCDKQEEGDLLQCNHRFCQDCFSKYVHGSLDELLHFLRCSICGEVTVLATETKTEVVQRRFGRDLTPKLYTPIGFAQRLDGSYVTVEPRNKRIYIFNRSGKLKKDFAYVHNYVPLQGLVVSLADEIVVPFAHGRQKLLGYFTPSGEFTGATYLPESVDVKSLAVNNKNDIIVSDVTNHCLYIVHERRRIVKTIDIPQTRADKFRPEPYGVTTTPRGDIVLADRVNNCIKILGPEGELIKQFGSRGNRPGQFNQPSGVCVDSRGRIIVADQGNHRVQIFNYEGVFLHFVVRYNDGEDVYMTPVDLLPLPNNMLAVLLRGERDATAAEIRIYSCVQVK